MRDKALAMRYSFHRSLGLIHKKVGPFESSLKMKADIVCFPLALYYGSIPFTENFLTKGVFTPSNKREGAVTFF